MRKAHKIFENIINRNFNVDEPNKVWCTDFTYLPMSNGKMRYNCTIIDLYNREVIATLNSNHITARLAVDTLKIAMKRRENFRNVILHSDQGSQYTSKEFIDFINNIIEVNNIDLVIPGIEQDLESLIKNYDKLNKKAKYVLNNKELFDTFHDKKKTYEFLANQIDLIPYIYFCDDLYEKAKDKFNL